MARSRRAWTRPAVRGGALGASAAVLLGLALVLVRDDKAGVATMFVGLASLALSTVAFVRPPKPPSQPLPVADAVLLDRAADKLAADVQSQWVAEAGLRSLHRPSPLRLTWATTVRRVNPPAQDITGGAVTGRVARLRLHGQLGEVADKFLALPHRRLVVLGPPGAGKTVLAMLLTLKLLERRQPGQPVPVLLGLSSWNPTKEHLHAWLARQLGEDYPALTSPTYQPDTPGELVGDGRVLPVLDGLDELPEQLRASAIGELDRARANRPLVVTCRSQEYEQAVAAGGGALASAAVVELQPVTAAEAIAFLRATAAPAPERWDRVTAHLHAQPDGPLAAALSTPLMVALARTIYTNPGRDPGELVDLAQAGGRAAVERHLLEGFIPAAYANPPPAPDTPAPRLRRPPSPELARRWLTLLATHLHRHQTRDLAWWQLPRLVPQRPRRLVVGLVVGLAFGLLVGPVGGIVLGLGLVLEFRILVGEALGGLDGGPVGGLASPGSLADLVVGLVFGSAGGLTLGAALGAALAAGPLAPRRVNLRVRRRLRDLFAQFRAGLTSAVRVGFVIGLAFVLLSALLVAALLSEFVGLSEDDLLLALVLALIGGLVGGLVFGLVFGLMEWLRSPADDARAVTPWSVHRDDRTAAIVFGLVGGLAFGLIGGLPTGLMTGELADGLGAGLTVASAGALVGAFCLTAWGQFTIVRAWLAVRGKLPWRLMAFLDDAHQRGVLRQAGAVYQFRHARLQAHLADTSPAFRTGR
ncbi:MAG TPA: NACHT domain-containing protein [Actinomycetota bacterium]|nr:NACHT domain-containing protein [Actinomycetota bacterium]